MMNIVKYGRWVVALLAAWAAPANALDTWSTTQGVLNMPLVTYSGKTYHNVTAVLGGVISVGSACSSTSTAADTLSSATGQLSIPAVRVSSSSGTSTYCNAQVWLSSITSVGGLCANASSCSQYFTPVPYADKMARSYSPSLSIVSGSLTNRARYLISDSSAVANSANYLSIGNDFTATAASGNASGSYGSYAVTSGTIPLSSTYKTYLSKLIQVVAVKDDGTNADVYYTDNKPNAQGYRLDSHLHPNESIDVDTTNGNILKFRRNISGPPSGTTFSTSTAMTPITTADGFVSFNYDTSTHRLQAAKRYIRSIVQDVSASCTKDPCYNASFKVDSNFTLSGYYVNVRNGVYSLVASATSATPLYFYGSSDGYAVPVSSLNPTNTAFTTANPAAAFPTSGTGSTTSAAVAATESNFASKVYTKYQSQVTAPGADQSTKTAADAQLVSIKQSVEANTGCNITAPTGTQAGDEPTAALRYSPEVYTSFRDALLSGRLVSDTVADGTPNQKLVPFVYFTNEYDPANPTCLAPMMVIITYGQPGGPHGLNDIPVPPAAGSNTANIGMTRLTNLGSQTVKIPMRNYGNVNLTNQATVNYSGAPGLATTLCTDVPTKCSASKADAFNWASTNDNGISFDGAQLFPILNNTLNPSNWKAELSTYGCHVGQGGGGPHCHADGFVPGQDNKLTLYSDADYAGRTHPPLVGFGYDGIAVFGRYRPQDTSMLGAGTSLDAFSGHNHDGIGYHYHARDLDMPTTPFSYTYTANGKTICSALDSQCVAGASYLGGTATPTKVSTLLQGAWKGNIAAVPAFRTSSKVLSGQN